MTKFVYLFTNFQCILSCDISNLGTGNIDINKNVISFSARIFTNSKCQVSLVVIK